VYLLNLLCILEFSCWYIFKSFSNLASPFFTSEMLDITSFLRQHKPQKYMYALCGYKLLIQRISRWYRWYFYTGSLQDRFTVIVHHKNNNVLIPPYNQLTSISWRNLPFIFLYLYATLQLHKYFLYNICFC